MPLETRADPMLLMQRLGRLYRALHALVQPQLEAQLGLHPKEMLVLAAVARGQTHPSGIGAQIGTPPPTTSRLLDRLTEAGLLERRADPADLRRFRMRLTPAGEQRLTAGRALVRETLTERLQHVPQDQLEGAIFALEQLEQSAGLAEARPDARADLSPDLSGVGA